MWPRHLQRCYEETSQPFSQVLCVSNITCTLHNYTVEQVLLQVSNNCEFSNSFSTQIIDNYNIIRITWLLAQDRNTINEIQPVLIASI